jgi:hypothetical protein
VAIVVAPRSGGEALNVAVTALAGVARSFGVEVIVLMPPQMPGAPGPTSLPLSVRAVLVERNEPESVWRARALTETDADIVEFVDDQTAGTLDWDEVAPRRLNIVGVDTGSSVDVRASLERMGVPDPGYAPAGAG